MSNKARKVIALQHYHLRALVSPSSLLPCWRLFTPCNHRHHQSVSTAILGLVSHSQQLLHPPPTRRFWMCTASGANINNNTTTTTTTDDTAQADKSQQQQQQSPRTYSSVDEAAEEKVVPKSTTTLQQHQNHHHVAHVRSFLSCGLLPYETGWAWQHVLLNRRLAYLRGIQQQLQLHQQQHRGNDHDLQVNANDYKCNSHVDNRDWILLFEHQPVYTLGRGATVDHLTFLSKSKHHNHCNCHGRIDHHHDDVKKDECRRRLCRTYRGKDASRLAGSNSSTIESNQPNGNMIMSVEEEVNHRLQLVLPQQEQQHPYNSVSPVLAPNGAPIYRIERGGEVTYHGPGQLVMYPLLHLKHPAYQPDLHWYLRQVEEVIIQTLDHFGIPSHRDIINTGVWVGKNKIAAVGVSSSRWITSHGLALNVCPDLSYFGRDIITPCGIEAVGRGVTSIAEILNGRQRHNSEDDHNKMYCPTLEEVAKIALKCFAKVFGIGLSPWGGAANIHIPPHQKVLTRQ